MIGAGFVVTGCRDLDGVATSRLQLRVAVGTADSGSRCQGTSVSAQRTRARVPGDPLFPWHTKLREVAWAEPSSAGKIRALGITARTVGRV
jgi:hypothetical protein